MNEGRKEQTNGQMNYDGDADGDGDDDDDADDADDDDDADDADDADDDDDADAGGDGDSDGDSDGEGDGDVGDDDYYVLHQWYWNSDFSMITAKLMIIHHNHNTENVCDEMRPPVMHIVI